MAKIIASCEPRCVLVAGSAAESLRGALAEANLSAPPLIGWLDAEAPRAPGLKIGFSHSDLTDFSGAPLDYRSHGADTAHILFTSGSTGAPKGVQITHDNALRFVEWAISYFGVSAGDRISGHPPLHFDLSTFDIYATLGAGAQLHLVPAELSLLPNKIADFIRRHELTQWFSAPSLLNYMAKQDVVAQGDFPALKRLLWCGEVFLDTASYGRIYKTGDLAKVGEDGLVYFLGRADSQIKSRGYRIELGEIETALNALGLLRECAVVAVNSDGFEGTAICCAYAPLPGDGGNPTTLRQALRRALPSYMLPSHWICFERLPQNGNGKIDRRALREQFQQSLSQAAQA